MIDNVLEYIPASAPTIISPQLSNILHLFITNMSNSNNIILRQCSSYGLLQLLRNYKDSCVNISHVYNNIIPAIHVVLSHPEARSEEYIGMGVK